jgi:hypothetical protein
MNTNKIITFDNNEDYNEDYNENGKDLTYTIDNKNIIVSNKNIFKINKVKKIKKRVQSQKWSFSDENFEYLKQKEIIIKISQNNFKYFDDVSKIVIQEINRKIYGYKQQDKIKKYLDEDKFLLFETIIHKMIDCDLKCRYCEDSMFVLYDISRELKQWSVDRIDNYLGHNEDNFHLACLDCNLKRRRRTDEKFLFTKQLNIVKQN